MEGLIPFIYKAIKERRARSYSYYYSRCNSTGSSRGRLGARVEDSSWDLQQKQWESAAGGKAPAGAAAEREIAQAHRRHRSLDELAGEVGASPGWRRRPPGRAAQGPQRQDLLLHRRRVMCGCTGRVACTELDGGGFVWTRRARARRACAQGVVCSCFFFFFFCFDPRWAAKE
uniref:Uncharacterized protein n=1 Tax=Zea mays TaxID=4577 RepID=B6UI87_MAIZE|nr:hypothetical protein [Zea mays]